MWWLETFHMMVISDYHAGFVQAFKRKDVTASHLNALRTRKGWKVGRGGGRTAGRSPLFSAFEIGWLRRNCKLSPEEYHRSFSATFGRKDVSADRLQEFRKRNHWKSGRVSCFPKGHVPANKGKKMPFNAGSARTQFKKGQRPASAKGVGHEHITKDGYVEILIARRNPHTGADRDFELKHRWLWEQAYGPIPAGMVLKCKGDKLNCDPSNWDLVPRAVLPRLNGINGRGYDAAPAELKPTIMAVTKLEHQVRERSRQGGNKEAAA
jgi:hypothetical protein